MVYGVNPVTIHKLNILFYI